MSCDHLSRSSVLECLCKEREIIALIKYGAFKACLFKTNIRKIKSQYNNNAEMVV